MYKNTGPGKYFIKVDGSTEVVRAWLFNFDIDGAGLKPAHAALLDNAIGPVIRDGGSVKLLGLASTTGQAAWDLRLGEQRTHTVVGYLRTRFGSMFTVAKEISFGKQMALAFGQEHLQGGTGDNQESEIWRGVVVNAWNRSPPPPPPPGVDVPFGNSTWAEDVGQTIDKVSWALGIIDLAADLLEIGAVTAVTGPAGLIVGAAGSIVTMPLLWASTDALANTNGEIQGGADAVQDMADQFSDPKLDSKPMSTWPVVKVPLPHFVSNPQPNATQLAWRAGQTKGCQNAVKAVLNLEQDPKLITLPSGKHIRLSGRLWLRAISIAYHDSAGVEVVVKRANEELKKRGRPPFPTH